MAGEVDGLLAAGLARGGSLENAVVVDGARVLNPGGLRMEDEFACHKLLDALGDLALAGARLRARFRAHRAGHALHNKLLRALFADAAAWEAAEPAHARPDAGVSSATCPPARSWKSTASSPAASRPPARSGARPGAGAWP